MFALAWLLLLDLPYYRTGLIIVGPVRYIAVGIIWNNLACGYRAGRGTPQPVGGAVNTSVSARASRCSSPGV